MKPYGKIAIVYKYTMYKIKRNICVKIRRIKSSYFFFDNIRL